MRTLIKVFKALSDQNRIRILKMLQIKSLCVCEITEVLNLATSTVSIHLSILRNANLIFDEKDGRWVNYHLNTSETEKYIRDLMPLIVKWLPKDEIVLHDAEKVSQVDRTVLCNGG